MTDPDKEDAPEGAAEQSRSLDPFLRQISESAHNDARRSKQLDELVAVPEIQATLRRIVERYPASLRAQLARALSGIDSPAGRLREQDWLLRSLDPASAHFQQNLLEALKFSARAVASSSSDPELYPEGELDDGPHPQPTARSANSPEAFFGKHAVTVETVADYLTVVAQVQGAFRSRRLVWRGQQDAAWPVQTSLHRHLVEVERINATEDALNSFERHAFETAARWGIGNSPAMSFLATLQHNGAPTRLLDVSRDPHVATWFAIEPDQKLDRRPARVVMWAIDAEDRSLPTQSDGLFWHAWESEDLRRKADWGTGTTVWPWFPPAAGNERMRAQRAGFLIGASSIVTTPIARLFSEYFDEDWNTGEIANATSFLGRPVPHDKGPDDFTGTPEGLQPFVPFVAIEIPARLKKPLRKYLETTGLEAATIYPDLGGLVRDLKFSLRHSSDSRTAATGSRSALRSGVSNY